MFMMSYVRCLYLFWYKEETTELLWYKLDVSGGFSFQVHRGGGVWVVTTCLDKLCYRKRLGKMRLKIIRQVLIVGNSKFNCNLCLTTTLHHTSNKSSTKTHFNTCKLRKNEGDNNTNVLFRD